jgi:hypothetical protein
LKILLQSIFNLFLAIDQLLNTILLGHPDETLSSRLGRTKDCERYFWVSPLRELIDTIFFFDVEYLPDGRIVKHCQKSIMPLEQQNFREFVDYEIWSWNK